MCTESQCRDTAKCATCILLFFLNDTATTEIYTLSLHDALPISRRRRGRPLPDVRPGHEGDVAHPEDRKSTRLNSSHITISYAVFCLKKETEHRTYPGQGTRSAQSASYAE